MREIEWGQLYPGDAFVLSPTGATLVFLKVDRETVMSFDLDTKEFCAVQSKSFDEDQIVYQAPRLCVSFCLE